MFSSDQIAVRQSQVDKLYAGLKDLAQERRSKLDEVLKLYKLSHEIDDLMQWIAEREVVASSHELGQDFEHVTVSGVKKHDPLHDNSTIWAQQRHFSDLTSAQSDQSSLCASWVAKGLTFLHVTGKTRQMPRLIRVVAKHKAQIIDSVMHQLVQSAKRRQCECLIS